MRRAFKILAIVVLGYVVLEALVFHTPLYAYFLSPDSSTGYVELVLNNELWRVKESSNQILAVGDSRMAVVPRIANEATNQSGYTYASIGVGGATPRDWYYMLRHVDPEANRYRAIVICLDTFDDDENPEDFSDRETDLSYLDARLGIADLPEFAWSYHDPERRWRAARGILFKGFVYKRDFQDLLLHPIDRIRYVQQARRDSHGWYYGYVAPADSLKGLQVDWEHRIVTPPPGMYPERAKNLKLVLTIPFPKDEGRHSAYFKQWLGKIFDHYRTSATRVVFVRVPRAPWIRPDFVVNPNSSVRQLAKKVNVVMLREDLMNFLEKPEFFRDEFHLNQEGLEQFTRALEKELRTALAPQ
ncbi:MAG: hypothetical protein ABI824_13880 [Acidobacteriota bacterium]